MSPICGWSGRVAKNWSNFSLNSSIVIFFRSFRMGWITAGVQPSGSFGAQILYSWGTSCRRGRAFASSLSLNFDWIPQLGTFPSRTCQVYSILYLSALLCWEIIHLWLALLLVKQVLEIKVYDTLMQLKGSLLYIVFAWPFRVQFWHIPTSSRNYCY